MLAGKGKLSASYRRQGEAFDARATAELRELRIDGLPIFEQNRTRPGHAQRRVPPVATHPRAGRATGEIAALEAKSDHALGKVVATNDATEGRLGLNAQGQADLRWSGRHDHVEAELSARGDQGGWTAGQILLALTPIVPSNRPGTGEATVRWTGRGRYDLSRDELIRASPHRRCRTPGRRAEASSRERRSPGNRN